MELFLLFSIMLTAVAFISIISAKPNAGLQTGGGNSDLDYNFLAATTNYDEVSVPELTKYSITPSDITAEAVSDNRVPQENAF